MEPFLVADDFDSNQATSFVIDASHNLSETTLSEKIDDLISIQEMIPTSNCVIPSIIIVPEVLRLCGKLTHVLSCVLCPTKIYVLVVYNFASLIYVQVSGL